MILEEKKEKHFEGINFSGGHRNFKTSNQLYSYLSLLFSLLKVLWLNEL